MTDPRTGTVQLAQLLDEVRSCFTRDDDLPENLLGRIDAALEHHRQGQQQGGAVGAAPVGDVQTGDARDADRQAFNAAIDFAIAQGIEAATFLDAWRHGDTSEWPEFSLAASETPSAEAAPPVAERTARQYAAMKAADDAFQSELVRAYGERAAGNARYQLRHDDASVQKAAASYVAAAEAWRDAVWVARQELAQEEPLPTPRA